MYNDNILTCTDAYKASHPYLYPKDAEAGRWYIAPRKALYAKQKEFVLFGLTYFREKFLRKQLTQNNIDKARLIWDKFGIGGGAYPFPYEGFQKIIDKYDGYIPVRILGVPEGTPQTDYNVPMVIVECEDPDLFWLPGFIETTIQRYVWYASTVATGSRNIKKFLTQLYKETTDEKDFWTLDYRLHDFGARGATTGEQAALGGAAHLINFKGTDTMEAVVLLNELYNMPVEKIGCSIPAAEHSTVTSHGKDIAAEKKALLQMIDAYKGKAPLIAFVSDSYDYKRFVDEVWCAPDVIAKIREAGILPVIRPDSGDPNEMVLYALHACEKAWGVTINGKGLKVLNGINVIQGDGMRYETIVKLYNAVVEAGFAPQNVAVGMGGGLLQAFTRDDMSWSMKMFQIRRNGMWYNIQKNPKTASAKKAWNPNDGLDEAKYIVYFDGVNPQNEVDGTMDFEAIRERAAV